MLNDKEFEPVLIGPQAGVKLIVPTPDKVGQLRPSSTPEMGKSCWMSFSNKGRVVQPRDCVNIVAGRFRLDGLRWISVRFPTLCFQGICRSLTRRKYQQALRLYPFL